MRKLPVMLVRRLGHTRLTSSSACNAEHHENQNTENQNSAWKLGTHRVVDWEYRPFAAVVFYLHCYKYHLCCRPCLPFVWYFFFSSRHTCTHFQNLHFSKHCGVGFERQWSLHFPSLWHTKPFKKLLSLPSTHLFTLVLQDVQLLCGILDLLHQALDCRRTTRAVAPGCTGSTGFDAIRVVVLVGCCWDGDWFAWVVWPWWRGSGADGAVWLLMTKLAIDRYLLKWTIQTKLLYRERERERERRGGGGGGGRGGG